MSAFAEIARGVALVAFAAGALAITVGASQLGRRLITFALVLVVVYPLFTAGVARLQLEVPHGLSLNAVVLVLALAIVLLAGLVALLRSKGKHSAEGTSQKKRLERAP